MQDNRKRNPTKSLSALKSRDFPLLLCRDRIMEGYFAQFWNDYATHMMEWIRGFDGIHTIGKEDYENEKKQFLRNHASKPAEFRE